MVVPTIVPSGVMGKSAPGNRIRIGQIGFGRIAMGHDLPLTLKHDMAVGVAVADGRGAELRDTMYEAERPQDWEQKEENTIFANDPYMQGWAAPKWAWVPLTEETTVKEYTEMLGEVAA